MDTNFSLDNANFDLASYVKEQLKGGSKASIGDLGDWSICNQVCGGGMQVKYKYGCKPPMAGYQCKKKPLKLKRLCNSRPCKPGESSEKQNLPDEAWKFKQPTITLPVTIDSKYISHRFQQ